MTLDKLRPRAVIFDLGSTLIEYESLPWAELVQLGISETRLFLLGKGITVPGDDTYREVFNRIRSAYRERAGTTLEEWTIPQIAEEFLNELGLASDDGLIDDFFAAFYGPVEERLYAYDDTVSTLEEIHGAGLVTGLVSNTVFPEQTHRDELDRFGIAPYLDFALFSSSFGRRKPHPSIFYKAANLAGFAPGECLYVGDRYQEDIVGPTDIGMPALLKIKPGREYPESMPRASRRIHALAEMKDHAAF